MLVSGFIGRSLGGLILWALGRQRRSLLRVFSIGDLVMSHSPSGNTFGDESCCGKSGQHAQPQPTKSQHSFLNVPESRHSVDAGRGIGSRTHF